MTEPLENRIADEVVSLMRNQIPATEQGQYKWGAIWRGTQKIVQAQTGQPQGTPSSRWAEAGEPDPHDTRYNCGRAELLMGDLTDDELANAAFLNYDRWPRLEDVIAGKAHPPISYMTAVKDRIRWLSRKLSEQASQTDISKLTRYDFLEGQDCNDHCRAEMVADETGKWIKYNDVIKAMIGR